MDIQKLFLSKWLYYSTIAAVLLLLFLYYLPSAWEGNDIAANFLSEIWGLFFTLAIFIVVLDFREWLERKSVEDRVKKKIGRIIRTTFDTISILCRVERVHYEPHSKEKQIKLVEKQLKTLASGEFKFTPEAEIDLLNESIRKSFEMIVDSRANRLGRIEERYSKFLSSDVRASLMDIQEYLDKLRLEFSIPHMRNEDYFDSVRGLIGKLMVEILKLKNKGFWVDW